MSLAQASYQPQIFARDVLMGRDPEILEDINRPGVAASIWARRCSHDFREWIDSLPMEQLPELRTVVPVHLAEAAAIAACEQVKLPPSPEREMLTGDAGALALIISKVLDVRQVRIRFDVSDEVMCPKFHVDNVPARLLCTYRGAGTEYVLAGAEENPERISKVPRGAVGLFRGGAWHGEERTGLLHRSPDPAAGSGPRLLLVIDPVS
ncbi:MAG: DUF1826 domain-containing protein [Roseibium sp.]|uniref:DUF1826 domain-containing protein n=1 Tax=Roseibium sp. TaxID=1936156 RepID=UPI003D9C525A